MPESARYLVAAGHKDKAEGILKAAAKMNKRRLPSGTLSSSVQVDEISLLY